MRNDKKWWEIMRNDDHWWSMIINGDQWRSMMINGDQWWSMMINHDQWWSMVINEGQWRSMVINGDQRWSIMINDHQWWSMIINGDQWWSMGSGLSIHWVPIILNHIPTRSLSLNPSILGHLSSKPCMQGLEKRHKTVLLKRSDAPVDSLETFQGFSNAHDDRCSNSFVMHIIWSDHGRAFHGCRRPCFSQESAEFAVASVD